MDRQIASQAAGHSDRRRPAEDGRWPISQRQGNRRQICACDILAEKVNRVQGGRDISRKMLNSTGKNDKHRSTVLQGAQPDVRMQSFDGQPR